MCVHGFVGWRPGQRDDYKVAALASDTAAGPRVDRRKVGVMPWPHTVSLTHVP